MPTSHANATWEGGLKGGNGKFEGKSGIISGAYSFGTRFGGEAGTNPEELLAAAEAACYSMALAAGLEAAGTPAQSVHTEAACTVEPVEGGFKISTMKLKVNAKVPGVSKDAFQKAAQDTKSGCPVSKALAGVDISVDATLD
ncbi:MAG TPA: OsmC family peroxiredoxin [Longimicrobiaceae bacterium]|nr:OsmC family peroxiredoxin [Longimicrobiaceae bacterium]